VVDSVKEFFQVNVHNPAIALFNILLTVAYRLMGASAKTKCKAVLRERFIQILLQHLHNRLLNETVQHCGNTEFAYSASGHYENQQSSQNN